MGSVFMAFDASFGVKFGVAVAAEVMTLVNDENLFTEFMDETLSHSKTEEAGTDD